MGTCSAKLCCRDIDKHELDLYQAEIIHSKTTGHHRPARKSFIGDEVATCGKEKQ